MANDDTKSTTLTPESGFRVTLLQMAAALLLVAGASYTVGMVAAEQSAHEASPGHPPTVERLRQVELTQASVAASLKSLVTLERRRK